MNKFTLFTLLLSITVMSVMAELLANDYVEVGASTNLLQQPSEQVEVGGVLFELGPDEVKPAAEDDGKVKRRELAGDVEIEANTVSEPQLEEAERKVISAVDKGLPKNSFLTESQLREAGFFAPHVAVNAPNFAAFGVFPIPRDRYQVELVQAQIFEDNTAVGILQEFALSDSLAAQDFYNFVKKQGVDANYFEVNEVDSYGDRSMYFNHAVRKDQVFIVVQKGSHLWAFTYVKHLHPKFRELITSLM